MMVGSRISYFVCRMSYFGSRCRQAAQMSRLAIRPTKYESEARADEPKQIDATRRVTPLVVIPARHLQQSAIDHVGALRVDDARVWVADEVGGHELFLGVLQNAIELARRRLLEGRIDLGHRHRLLNDHRQ